MTTTAMPAADTPAPQGMRRTTLAGATLGAVGVVYGDIGTSPLYTIKEVFAPATGVPLDASHLVGAVSVILWSLVLVVTLKYVILILRADNHGEGGGLALTALATHAVRSRARLRRALLVLGVFGATLFYGDSVITPAISVLGAMEGLEVVTPALKTSVVPASVVILLGLFLVQRHGTGVVGRFFGPVIALWFVTIGAIGLVHIVREPAILAALDPREAARFIAGRGWHLLATIGAIVLAITGTEALYADMGHFGRRPIQLAWTGLVFPALALNYMGQGALLMSEPGALANPFFRMFPPAALLPALVLATLAAIIASQAVISGSYSMTRQAIQLGFLPRMTVRYTSAAEAGQIYLPLVNVVLLLGVIAATLHFGGSGALAGAYGIAVTMTMAITTLLTYFVVRHGWKLPAPLAFATTGFFLALDAFLIASCAIKFFDGGWFPLVLGLAIFVVMSTWQRGRALLLDSIGRDGLALRAFVGTLATEGVRRVERTAVYPVADAATVPQALLHNLKHYQVLHERNVVLTVVFEDEPWVKPERRIEVEPLGRGFWRVQVRYGFMDTPDVPRALALAAAQGIEIEPAGTSYFLSRETVVPTPGGGMAAWREKLFAAMSRNAGEVASYFRLPDNAVVELGTRVQI